MWPPYWCSTSTSPGSSRRWLCRQKGCLSAHSKSFLSMDPTNWQRCRIPPSPHILMYCIEHHSDILLQIALKTFILKKFEEFAPFTQTTHAQEGHYKVYYLSHFAWERSLSFSALPGECKIVPKTGPERVPSTSLPIHCSPVILPPDTA